MKSSEFIKESNPLLGFGNHPQDPSWKRKEVMPSVKTLEPMQIALKHNVSIQVIEKQLDKGTQAEMEHTTDVNTAREIALDHLAEMPDYYDKLEKMERE